MPCEENLCRFPSLIRSPASYVFKKFVARLIWRVVLFSHLLRFREIWQSALQQHKAQQPCANPKEILALPKVQYPKPNIHAALKSSQKGEEDKIASGLAALHHEDPTFLYAVDGELHQTILSAQGELHLEVIAERLRKRYNVHVELTEPRVRYRQTIKARGDSKYRHKKQTGDAGQFAEVWMKIEPKPRDTGLEFTQSLSGQNVDRVFVPSVEKGVHKASEEGILAGYRVVNVKVNIRRKNAPG